MNQLVFIIYICLIYRNIFILLQSEVIEKRTKVHGRKMVPPIPSQNSDHLASSIPLTIGLFVSVSALVALCIKFGRPSTLRYESESRNPNNASKSPLLLPKKLVTGVSNKALALITKKKGVNNKSEAEPGEDGVWQRNILMGEKCQPPDFSGVIYYDVKGNRLSEPPPRSPRASPFHPSVVFPMANGSS